MISSGHFSPLIHLSNNEINKKVLNNQETWCKFAPMKKRKQSISGKIHDIVNRELRARNINKVVVGVSGGADSTALLLALAASGVQVVAVHCNFHLRGEESMRDQRHVEQLCPRLGVELRVVDFDVAGYCASHPGVSVEMACRDLRYDFFREMVAEVGADRIAVAHNADDNVETLLLNLFRGSGVTGLRGMLPDTGEIVRPLLSVSRGDIEEYLSERREEFVVDSSNLESDYRRNYIRNELLPAIEGRWPGVRKAIGSTIVNLQSEERVLNWCGQTLLGGDDPDFLPMDSIFSAPDRFWLIRRFAALHGATRDVALEILDVFEKKGGTQLIVGKSWKSGRGRLRFEMKGLRYISEKHKG